MSETTAIKCHIRAEDILTYRCVEYRYAGQFSGGHRFERLNSTGISEAFSEAELQRLVNEGRVEFTAAARNEERAHVGA